MAARAVGGRVASILIALSASNVTAGVPEADASAPSVETHESLRADVGATSPSLPTVTAASAAAPRKPSRVVLVTLDGLRWQEVFAGAGGAPADEPLMPNLHRLVAEQGTMLGGPGCEHDVRASGPNYVSLPGYLEIFGGRPSATCRSNSCGQTTTATVLDEIRDASPNAGDVAVFSSWSKYGRAVTQTPHSFVVSTGAKTKGVRHLGDDAVLRSHLDEGAAHAGFPGWGDYRPDVYTRRAALRYLETVKPRMLVIGLGDADDYGHRGDPKRYRQAIREADAFLGELDRTVSAIEPDGRRTAILVMTDHGRERSLRHHGAGFPESARVFVAGFGAGIARRGTSCAAAPLRLAHVASVVRTLLGIEANEPESPLVAEMVAPSARRAPADKLVGLADGL